MSFFTAQPSASLAPFIKQYWAIENLAEKGKEYLQRIVPSGLIELSFYLGDKPKVMDEQKDFTGNTVLSGHLKGYYELKITGQLSIFSISFKPNGAMMFFGIPLIEFYDKNIPLENILKREISELETRLSEARPFKDKLILVENFLMAQLIKNYKTYEQTRINHSITLINSFRGKINIDDLASETCLSRKQFERTFGEFIGSSPKQFLKIIRFQNAIHIKENNSGIHLADLAYDAGFYDQSHMNNDFRSMAGMTPKEYFESCEPYSDYFN